MPSNEAIEIDNKKKALEAKAVILLRNLFNNIAIDISNLIRSNTNINPIEIANNYKPDLIGILRSLYRETIKTFSFGLRNKVEKKYNVNFEIKEEINKLETKQEDEQEEQSVEINEQQEKEVNKLFFLEMTLFINNQSERQANLITNTNIREINSTIDKSIANYNRILSNNLIRVDKLNEQLRSLEFERLLNADVEKEIIKINNEIEKLNIQKNNIIKNRSEITAKEFEKTFKERGEIRSKTIAEYEVGHAESKTRNKEADILDKVVLGGVLLNVKKNWESVGDSRVRDAHVVADATYRFNPIPMEEDFFVGGERLRYARDENGSASNIINCRCNNIYSIN